MSNSCTSNLKKNDFFLLKKQTCFIVLNKIVQKIASFNKYNFNGVLS